MAGATAALLASACDGPTEPRRGVPVLEPAGRLTYVSAHPFPYYGLGSFEVRASVDTASEWTRDPLRVRVRTTGGDHEQIDLDLLRAFQPIPRQIIVAVHDGVHVAALRARMDAGQLRFGSFGLEGDWGVLHVVSGDPGAALGQVRSWGEVRSADPSSLGRAGPPASRLPAAGTLPMDEAIPIAGNGRLELRPGEAATVEYLDADGVPASLAWEFGSRSEADVRAFVPLVVREVERFLYGDSAPRPPLLIDAASFAEGAWTANGVRMTAAEAVAGLEPPYLLVDRSNWCRDSAARWNCWEPTSGTVLSAGALYRLGGFYQVTVYFRAPTTVTRCFYLKQPFRFTWSRGAWRADPLWPPTEC